MPGVGKYVTDQDQQIIIVGMIVIVTSLVTVACKTVHCIDVLQLNNKLRGHQTNDYKLSLLSN